MRSIFLTLIAVLGLGFAVAACSGETPDCADPANKNAPSCKKPSTGGEGGI